MPVEVIVEKEVEVHVSHEVPVEVIIEKEVEVHVVHEVPVDLIIEKEIEVPVVQEVPLQVVMEQDFPSIDEGALSPKMFQAGLFDQVRHEQYREEVPVALRSG